MLDPPMQTRRPATRRDPTRWTLLAIGTISIANALWMLVGPMHWYTELPAAVPDTGPFNPHFVRDIGCAFLATGVALVWAERSPRFRLPLATTGAVFLAAHALLHVYDTATGALDPHHWLLDLPGVYAPGVVLPAIAWRLWREDEAASAARRSDGGGLAARDPSEGPATRHPPFAARHRR